MWSNISAANNVSAGTWLSTRPGPKTWRRQGSKAVDSFLGLWKCQLKFEMWAATPSSMLQSTCSSAQNIFHAQHTKIVILWSLVYTGVQRSDMIWYKDTWKSINRWIDICISTICHIATRFILQEHYLVFTDILPKDFMAQFYLPSDRLQKIWLWRW